MRPRVEPGDRAARIEAIYQQEMQRIRRTRPFTVEPWSQKVSGEQRMAGTVR